MRRIPYYIGMSETAVAKREIEMSLIRSPESLKQIKKAYQYSDADKWLRSYFLSNYQLEIIDILQAESGISKGGVVRQIIDEWVNMKLRENGGT